MRPPPLAVKTDRIIARNLAVTVLQRALMQSYDAGNGSDGV